MAHDVFISHSTKDKVTADAVCAVLEARGIRCWIAPRDIVPGKDWGEAIVAAIKGAKVMVLVLSGSANESTQIKREVDRAVSKGITVIPMRIEDVVPSSALEYYISTAHWLDAFVPPLETHLIYLAGIIQKVLEGMPVEKVPGLLAAEGVGTETAGASVPPPPPPSPGPILRFPPPPPYRAMPPPPPFAEKPTAPLPRRASRRTLWVAAALLAGIALGIGYKVYRDRAEPPGRFHRWGSKLRDWLN